MIIGQFAPPARVGALTSEPSRAGVMIGHVPESARALSATTASIGLS